MNTQERIINKMPDEFSRQELIKKVLNEGYAFSTSNSVLEYACITGMIERIGRGKYRKTLSQEETVRKLKAEGWTCRQIADRLNISKSWVQKLLK